MAAKASASFAEATIKTVSNDLLESSNSGDLQRRHLRVTSFGERHLEAGVRNFEVEAKATRRVRALDKLNEHEIDSAVHTIVRMAFLKTLSHGGVLRRDAIKTTLGSADLVAPILHRARKYLRENFGMDLVPAFGPPCVEYDTNANDAPNFDKVTDFVVTTALDVTELNKDVPPASIGSKEREDISKAMSDHDVAVRGLLTIVLGFTLLQQGQSALEEDICAFLIKLDKQFESPEHPIFGEWKTLIFKTFVAQRYLVADRRSSEESTQYSIGSRARSDIGVVHLYSIADQLVNGINTSVDRIAQWLGPETLVPPSKVPKITESTTNSASIQ